MIRLGLLYSLGLSTIIFLTLWVSRNGTNTYTLSSPRLPENHFTLVNNHVKILSEEHRIAYTGSDLGNNTKIYNKALRKHNAVVLSVCNAAKHRFCDFVKSAQSYGAFLHIMKFGSAWMRNLDKLFVMNDAVQKYTNETIIIFADCLDVIFNDEVDIMISKFKEKKVNFIVPVEHICWPNDVIQHFDPKANITAGSCAKAYDIVGSQNPCLKRGPRFINSGTYIAYARVLKEFLGAACNEITTNHHKGYSDQKYFHEAHLLRKFDIYLDHCVEFTMIMLVIEHVCWPDCPWARRNQDFLEYVPTRSRPAFVHFNSDTKTTIYDNYVNKSMIVKTPKINYDVPMFWVNNKPHKIEDFCPN